MPGNIRNFPTLGEEPVSLPQLADDLLWSVPASSHRDDSPFAQHPGLWALIMGGPVSRGQVIAPSPLLAKRRIRILWPRCLARQLSVSSREVPQPTLLMTLMAR